MATQNPSKRTVVIAKIVTKLFASTEANPDNCIRRTEKIIAATKTKEAVMPSIEEPILLAKLECNRG